MESSRRRHGEIVSWPDGWELEAAAGRPWAGLSERPVLVTNATLWLIVAAVVVLYFIIDHNFYASLGIGRAGRDLGADLAYVDHGATRLNKLAAYALFGALGVGLILRRAKYRLRAEGPLAFCLLALLAWAAVSLLWTTDPNITVRRGGVLVIMIVLTIGLLRQLSLRELALTIGLTSLVFLALGIGAELMVGRFDPLRPGYRFAGTIHPGHQGANCALAMMAGVWFATSPRERWSHRWVGLAVAVFALVFLVLTKARAAFFPSMVATAIMLLFRMPRYYKLIMPAAVVGMAASFLFLLVTDLAETPWSFLLLGRSVEQFPTLNNRVPLWAAMMVFAAERPIIGYGYGAFVDPERGAMIAAEVGGYVLGGPHSAYMSILLDLGAVGLLLFTSALVLGVAVAIRAHRREAGEGYLFLASALVFYALTGILGAHMVYPTVSLWFLLVLGAAAFTRREWSEQW